MEYVVHTRLKSVYIIGYPKGHQQGLKVAIVASECSLWDILIPHLDLMVS